MVRHMISHKVATDFKFYTYVIMTRVNRIEYFIVTTVNGSVYLIPGYFLLQQAKKIKSHK